MHCGVLGAVIGILGGIIGSYFSIKNTNSPRERALMVRFSCIIWLSLAVFLGLMMILPNPFRLFLWIPYIILLPASITRVNKRQRQIIEEEKGRN